MATMSIEQILKDVRGMVPRSFYNELDYNITNFRKGRVTKEACAAVIKDIIREIHQRQRTVPVRVKKTRLGQAYSIGDNEQGFNLLSEPTEGNFVNSYHDVVSDHEEFRAENPLEQKGRILAPLFLDSYPDFLLGDKKKTIGIDVARFGDDKTVLLVLHGGHVVDVSAFYRKDIGESTGIAIEAINEHRPSEVVVDQTGGVGAGVVDNLRNLGMEDLCIITGIEFHALPRSDKWNAADARTEMALILQDRLRKGEITLPFHKELIEQLAQLKYRYRMDGKIILEPKEQFKKRNKKSPDFADALMLANYSLGDMEVF